MNQPQSNSTLIEALLQLIQTHLQHTPTQQPQPLQPPKPLPIYPESLKSSTSKTQNNLKFPSSLNSPNPNSPLEYNSDSEFDSKVSSQSKQIQKKTKPVRKVLSIMQKFPGAVAKGIG